MKNQVLVGYQVFKKIQVRGELGSGPLYQRTFAALAKWFIDTKVWNICVYYNAKFSMATEFYHVMSFKSINIVFETGKYHSWPNTLPFRVGYWGANTRTPGSDPSTRSSPILISD